MLILSCVDGYLGCFPLLAIVNNGLLWTSECIGFFEYLFSVILGVSLAVELLGHVVILFIFLGKSSLALTVVYHFLFHCHWSCVSTSLSILILLFFFFIIKAILMGIKWYLIVVLTCIFLMTNCVFMGIPFFCIHSWKKSPFKTFTHFFIGLFVFLLLNFKGSLYILGIRLI